MNQCTISGCRYLQTTCISCGRIVCTKTLPEAGQWISVKERLPDECADVLLYCPITKSVFVGFLLYSLDNEPICYHILDLDESDESVKLDEVSHWMRRPENPED
jgi:Protein of unknown function (DUF551)